MAITRDYLNRKFLLRDDISPSTSKSLIEKFYEIEFKDNLMASEFKDYVKSPIMLYVASEGGSTYDGVLLFNTIEQCETPIYTICNSHAMSAAFTIFLAGKRRFVSKHSVFVYHEVRTSVSDTLSTLIEKSVVATNLQLEMDEIITNKTKITQHQLDDFKSCKKDWYINSELAIELGIAEPLIKL